MRRPPRRAKDPMITLPLVAQVVGAAVMIVTGTLFVFQREVSENKVISLVYTVFILKVNID